MSLRLSWSQCAICALIVVILALPAGVLAGGSGGKTSQVKEWTLMMYWDADNSLEFTTEFAMSTWEKSLSSNANVNIVALIDLKSVDGTWIYDFEGGARKLVATWPEMNTSDPLVLEKFVQFCMDKFPAKKTMLDLQDHGYSWRGVCEDETNGDTLMSLHQIATALKDVKAANKGKGVDIISCDACNMASVEMAYELRNTAPILLASESTVPFDGFPYQMFITKLVANPAMSPTELSTIIVHDYVTYYGSKWDFEHIYNYQQDFATMSAFDLSKTAAMGPTFAKMTGLLEPLIPTHMKQVQAARGYALIGTWTNMASYEWGPDAWAFFDGLRGINGALDTAISQWEATFSAALLVEDHSKKYGDSVHGLNINFPPSLSQYNSVSYPWEGQFVYTNAGLDLIAESSWNDCLLAYYGGK
jgi:hypothetical protein